MLVENPSKWLFRSKNFFRQKCPIVCIWLSIYLPNNALLFFSPVCFSFSRKSKRKYPRAVEWCAMKRNKRKFLCKFDRFFSVYYVAQVLKARACHELWYRTSVQILNFSRCLFFFLLFVYYIFVNKKNLFVDLNHNEQCQSDPLVQRRRRHFSFTWQPSRTDFILIDWNDLLQIVALVRHQALFQTIIKKLSIIDNFLSFWSKKNKSSFFPSYLK